MALTIQNIINTWLANIVAKSQWNDGVSLHSDFWFRQGSNDLTVYNIANNDCVLFNRVKAVENLFKVGNELVITNIGYASPNLGGFSFEDEAFADRVIVTRFLAKIPIGYEIDFFPGEVGDNSTSYWYGSNLGTGQFMEYINVLVCGSTGTFNVGNSFALFGNAGTPENPITWSLAFANSYDLSASYYQYFQTNKLGEDLQVTNLELNKTKLGVQTMTLGTANKLRLIDDNGNSLVTGYRCLITNDIDSVNVLVHNVTGIQSITYTGINLDVFVSNKVKMFFDVVSNTAEIKSFDIKCYNGETLVLESGFDASSWEANVPLFDYTAVNNHFIDKIVISPSSILPLNYALSISNFFISIGDKISEYIISNKDAKVFRKKALEAISILNSGETLSIDFNSETTSPVAIEHNWGIRPFAQLILADGSRISPVSLSDDEGLNIIYVGIPAETSGVIEVRKGYFGSKGDSLTYSSLTPENKEELRVRYAFSIINNELIVTSNK